MEGLIDILVVAVRTHTILEDVTAILYSNRARASLVVYRWVLVMVVLSRWFCWSWFQSKACGMDTGIYQDGYFLPAKAPRYGYAA